jgi:hypothetical protein
MHLTAFDWLLLNVQWAVFSPIFRTKTSWKIYKNCIERRMEWTKLGNNFWLYRVLNRNEKLSPLMHAQWTYFFLNPQRGLKLAGSVVLFKHIALWLYCPQSGFQYYNLTNATPTPIEEVTPYPPPVGLRCGNRHHYTILYVINYDTWYIM